MAGEVQLAALLKGMAPQLQPERYVFCTLAGGQWPLDSQPLAMVVEAEGLTVIVPKAVAQAKGWAYTYECRQITLTVHSSLEAVGFLAAITTALAEAGISVNPVSAYHHDHLFVPVAQAEQAMACLGALAS